MSDRKEYIERGALIARLKASPLFSNVGMDGRFILGAVVDLIKKQPTADVVEVVRCGECAKYQIIKTQTCTIAGCRRLGFSSCPPDDYCSYGERKEGGNNEQTLHRH